MQPSSWVIAKLYHCSLDLKLLIPVCGMIHLPSECGCRNSPGGEAYMKFGGVCQSLPPSSWVGLMFFLRFQRNILKRLHENQSESPCK